MILVAICQRPHFKIPHGSRTVIRCMSTSCHRKITKLASCSKFESCMTLDQGRNPKGPVKNWHIKVAFLLGKSVLRHYSANQNSIWNSTLCDIAI